MTLFPAGQDLLGKKASDLVGEDLCVYEDILRVSKEDTWKIEVDESEVITFNFEKAVLE